MPEWVKPSIEIIHMTCGFRTHIKKQFQLSKSIPLHTQIK